MSFRPQWEGEDPVTSWPALSPPCPAILLALTLFAQWALADDGFRCGSELVNLGDSQEKVQSACGPPDAMRDLSQPNAPSRELDGQSAPYIPNIVWIYYGSQGQFNRILSFGNGALVDVREGMESQAP